jgi:two-component sensor histidine kinase
MAIVPVSTIASFHSMTKKDSLKAKEFMETIDDNFQEHEVSISALEVSVAELDMDTIIALALVL